MYSNKYYLHYTKLTIFSFQFAQKRRKKTLIALLLFAHKKTNMLVLSKTQQGEIISERAHNPNFNLNIPPFSK